MIGKKFASDDAVLRRIRILERKVQSISTALPYSVQPASTAVAPVVEENINLIDTEEVGIKELRVGILLADDATYTLPTKDSAAGAWGWAQCKDNNYAIFYVVNKGTVILLHHDNAVANADTDGKLCIGTEDAQNPLIIKNRCGSTRILTVVFWYT